MNNADGYSIPEPFDFKAIYAARWTLEDALPLIRAIENFAPLRKCHVALTGGVLYKDGDRKDLDLMFYRVRQAEKIDVDGLLADLSFIGFEIGDTYGWVTKATFGGKKVDLFFPERPDDPSDGHSIQ